MKLLIYGLDGGDLEILKIFSKQMPFFNRFLKDNISINLTEDLINRGWVEILTGKEGKDTRGFYMAPLLDGTHRCSTSFKMSDIKDENIVPLWKLAEQRRASYFIMNVPTTTPVPSTHNGVVVGSAGGGLNKVEGIPEALVSDDETREFLQEHGYIVDIRIPNDEIDETEELFKRLSEKESRRTQCFIELCKKNTPDFGFLVNRGNTIVEYLARSEIESYEAISKMSEFMLPGAPKGWVHSYLEKHFSELDSYIKRLYEELKPDHFIITADHGMLPSKYWANINPFLIKNGWLVPKSNKSSLSALKKVAKKILGSTATRASKKISPGLRDTFSDYNWNKSVAFGNTYIPGIFVNDKIRFDGPVNRQEEVDKLIRNICETFNAIPEDERAGMKAVPYRSKRLDGRFSDRLPDIKLEGSEGIFFHEKGKSLIWHNENYGPVPKDLHKVTHAAFTGDKGPNPLCVMTQKTASFISEDDEKNLTLIYKLVDRSCKNMNAIKKIVKKIMNLLRRKRFIRKTRHARIQLPVKAQINWKQIRISINSVLELGEEIIIRGTLDLQKEGASLIVGKRSFLGGRSVVVSTERIEIGDDVLISHDCYITDTAGHSMNPEIRKNDIPNRWKGFKDWSVVSSAPIKIGNKSWIGPKSIILKGVTIGEGAVVAAGSVVTKDIPPFSLAAGVPAKVIKSLKNDQN